MRKILSVLVLLTGALIAPYTALAQGQGLNPQPSFQFASDYGQWVIVSQQPQTYTWSGTNSCQIPKVGGGTFFAFTTGTPVFVRDALNPAHNETVSVTAPVNTSSSCGFTGSFTFTHTSFSVLSATGGAQEAINVLSSGSQSSQTDLVLNRNWYQLLTGLPSYSSTTPATVIAALTGSSNIALVDVTTAPYTFYTWNGTSYVSNGGSAAPAVTFGAGAGTGPVLKAIAGNGSTGTVTFITGTSPTLSAAAVTLTWPAVAAGGFNHKPACTFVSVGANVPPSTGAVTNPASSAPFNMLYTAGSSALTASTAYSFNYSCQ